MEIKGSWVKSCSAVCFLVLCNSLAASCQSMSIDSDFITWRISSVRNTKTGVTAKSTDFFKSSPDSIVWVSDGGRAVDKLHIDSKFETWPDVMADGSVSYNVVWKNIQGTIAFLRNHGEAKITTEFIKNNVNQAPYEFSVSDVIKD